MTLRVNAAKGTPNQEDDDEKPETRNFLVPGEGFEPSRPFGQRILSPQRLPFRHPGERCKLLTFLD